MFEYSPLFLIGVSNFDFSNNVSVDLKCQTYFEFIILSEKVIFFIVLLCFNDLNVLCARYFQHHFSLKVLCFMLLQPFSLSLMLIL